MHKATTITGQIERLIEAFGGSSICDDCITDRLGLSVRSQANVVTRELGKEDGYDRGKARCQLCGAAKTVTCRKA